MLIAYDTQRRMSGWVCVLALHEVTSSLSFFFSSRRRHTRSTRDWSSDVCSSDLGHTVTHRIIEREMEPLERCPRSEERRVGKECRSRWSAYQQKKKGAGGRSL